MKKVFWGYDPREVNESIEFLESQNESLNAKLANLNLEILAKNEQLAAQVNTVTEATSEEKKELANLRAKMESLTKENEKMQKECKSLQLKLSTMELENKGKTNDIPTEKHNNVGDLFQTAYSDLTTIKQNATEELKQYVLNCVQELEMSNAQIRELLSSISEAKQSAKVSFIKVVEDILGDFELLLSDDNGVEAKLENLDSIKSELYSKISGIVENDEDDEDDDAEPKVASQFPPLLTKALNEKKKTDEVLTVLNKPKTLQRDFEEKKKDDILVVSVDPYSKKDVFKVNI